MKAHRYRIRVQTLIRCDDEAHGEDALSFDVVHHDDVLAIVRRMHAANAFDRDEAAALAIGLKLFIGVMLRHCQDPLFAEVQPAMRAFIGNLKACIASATSDGPSP